MHPTVFTYHLKLYREIKLIKALFENGLTNLHLRKPDYALYDMDEMIQKIPEKYHQRIIVHKHFELIKKFDLGGVYVSPYLNECLPDYLLPHHVKVSFCMNIDDLFAYDGKFDKLVIGPVFRSISNPTVYYSRYSQKQLKTLFSENSFSSKILAIGGINHHNADMAFNMGFDGIVSLGAVWVKYLETNSLVKTVDAFCKIKETCLQLHN